MGSALDAEDIIGTALDAEDIIGSALLFVLLLLFLFFGQKESVGLMLCDANYVKLLLFHLHKGSRDKIKYPNINIQIIHIF